MTDEEGVDSHQIAGVMGLDMALAELRTEAFLRLDLLLRQREGVLGRGLLQAQQPVMTAEQAMPTPHASSVELTWMPASASSLATRRAP